MKRDAMHPLKSEIIQPSHSEVLPQAGAHGG